ncbi:MAG: AbrB family transcriptional regulator [Alphaproteobacteria bacterium]
MSIFANIKERLPRMALALAVAIPAGALLSWLETPIPWMIGPMVAVATLNLLGIRAFALPYGRQMGQVILGSAIGIYFTPPVLIALGANALPILLTTFSAFAIGGIGALVMSRVSGVDGKSAFFASIPGGSMAMANLAEKYGATMPPVAVAHSLRVSILVIVIPFGLTYGGIHIEPSTFRPEFALDYSILIPWLLASMILGELSERLRFHNGCLLTPLFVGALLALNGVTLSEVPSWLTDFAQLMFGLILGERYERAFFAKHKLFIPFALVNAAFIIIASAAVAFGISWAFDIPLATMIIATAPGGMAEMAIVAQALQMAVPTVMAFHLFRIIIVNMGTQYIYIAAMWIRGKRESETP